jgi:hypothetical protein
MKKKNWIFPAFIILLLSLAVITEGSSSPVSKEKCEPTCCSKKMGGCPEKAGNKTGSEFILDNLSHQFLLISSSNY